MSRYTAGKMARVGLTEAGPWGGGHFVSLFFLSAWLAAPRPPSEDTLQGQASASPDHFLQEWVLLTGISLESGTKA